MYILRIHRNINESYHCTISKYGKYILNKECNNQEDFEQILNMHTYKKIKLSVDNSDVLEYILPIINYKFYLIIKYKFCEYFGDEIKEDLENIYFPMMKNVERLEIFSNHLFMEEELLLDFSTLENTKIIKYFCEIVEPKNKFKYNKSLKAFYYNNCKKSII